MKKNKYLLTIDKIEKIRSRNNINWMNIMRIAFKYAPRQSAKIMNKINKVDQKISKLLKDLSK